MDNFNFDQLRNLSIGTVDFVTPNEVKVLLETDAPQNTALNTGVPSLFPRINGFVLIPNEVGALVGIICWLGVENSHYPKRKGFKDYDIIDLPFPLRKMSINPVGTLKREVKNGESTYKLERGIYSFPSIGDSVILPTEQQLRNIIENDDPLAYVKIGTAPIASNANVRINPNKLFGRHIAVLGNTGSGKSCSVAGLVRWSLDEANKRKCAGIETLNSRFIILDPNSEYSNSFNDLNTNIKRFKIELTEEESSLASQLKVPAWLWNSYEWSSFTQATARTQRPILRKTLRDIKSGTSNELSGSLSKVKKYFSTCLLSVRNDLSKGAAALVDFPGRNDFGNKLRIFSKAANDFSSSNPSLGVELETLANEISELVENKVNFVGRNGVTNFHGFDVIEVESIISSLKTFIDSVGGVTTMEGPDEDAPLEFDPGILPEYLEMVAEEQGVLPFLDYLIMRIRTMLSDRKMKQIVGKDEDVTLESWLENYISGTVIIDLSLVPNEIVHIIVSVISRITFEALQRYRRSTKEVLPTVIILEEAHNFIKNSHYSDEISATQLCNEVFEKIAREGRKFGLSLLISSQRPSELSPTILSQCNTFLLHRIVNDRDQDLIKRLVPDNIGGLLKELPVLPTRKAIMLGWASPIPVLVEMNELPKKYRPNSEDPDFWEVWTGEKTRLEKWNIIAEEWQDNPNEPILQEEFTEATEDLGEGVEQPA